MAVLKEQKRKMKINASSETFQTRTPTERKQRSRDRRRMRTIELPPEAFEAIEALRRVDDTSLGATVTRLVVKLAEMETRRK